MKVSDLKSITIKLASPERVSEWSQGEVKKPETINYRTQRPEKDGLFCEKIFGPQKDFECYCGKYKGIRYKGIICDRCGVEITRSQVRRERMGHIELITPVSHIWFLRSIPSRIGMILNIPRKKLEGVIYFVAYIIEKVDEKAKKEILKELKAEFEKKKKQISNSKTTDKKKKKELDIIKQKFSQTREEISSIEPFKIISEIEYQDLSLKYGEIFNAGTGAESLVNIFKKIDLKKEIKKLEKEAENVSKSKEKKLLKRLKLLQGLERAGLRPEWMFIKNLPVLPPGLRPMVQLEGGRYASSDLNDLYRRVINRNNRLKYLIEISAPEAIVRNEKRMLQEAVDSLMDNSMRKSQMTTASTGGRRLLKSLADVISGKQGRFRRNLLGKRVDYSGRSVIASGPELEISQCGLPKIMALELFRPFIIKKLLDEELVFNIKGASKFIDEKRPEVFGALEEIVENKLVLLNRAPTLHRLGIQAFKPVLIEGEAIKVHPLVCKAFNADFDGDQMGVFLPLSDEAQKEARELMLSSQNLLKPATGQPIIAPTKDIVLGIFWLTGKKREKAKKFFSSFNEAVSAYQLGRIEIRTPIIVPSKKGEPLETTCGRIIFNKSFPKNFSFINEEVDSKRLSKIIGQILRKYSAEESRLFLDNIKDLGFEYATLSGTTLAIDDFMVPEKKEEILDKKEKEVDSIESQFVKGFLSESEYSSKVIEIWHEAKDEIKEAVIEKLPDEGPIKTIVNSGARGSWGQPVQICGMKGLVSSPSGRIIELPIKNSFKEGFDVLEFFLSTHGARKGTVDTALRTSASGYLTRRLADVSHSSIVREKDCGDTQGREIFKSEADEIGQDFVFKIVGRVSLENIKRKSKTIVKKGEIINWDQAEEISKAKEIKKIKARTVLSCKSLRGVCQKCYGWEMGRNKLCSLGEAVGIIASQSIGEPGTQLTMRTFHLGGAAGGGDITRGLPRVEEILELRKVKGEGVISLVDGKVKEVDFDNNKVIIVPQKAEKGKKIDEMSYSIPEEADILVKKGEDIKTGRALCSGPLDLKKLFKTSGVDETQKYIIKEIQKVYVGEGINIHDKHLEIIARQMFSRVRITKSGDSPWVTDRLISYAEFKEFEKNLKKEKKNLPQAKPTLLGISAVALTSDSFLSSASFQETSRVLIRAALEGKEDKLRGLKENVIIGRIVPVGTGFRK